VLNRDASISSDRQLIDCMTQSEFFVERVNSEIRQQMEGVIALVDRLARQGMRTEAEACLSGIGDAAATVLQILSSSQELALASKSGLTFQDEPVALCFLADDLQARWTDRADKNGLKLLVSYNGDPLCTAMVDRERLLQAFDGLIGICLAGSRTGAIEASLHAKPEGDCVRLEGRVRGGGNRSLGEQALDNQEVEALFGLETALSFALSRQVVESQSGALRVETNQGGGDTLIFDLLARRAQKAAGHAQDSKAQETAAHILVVDDNATNRMVAETLCAMFDCTTEAVEDGREAIEIAKSGRFDLILMDIKMPQMDGVEATRIIRAIPGKAGRVPIIALTANADPEDCEAYLAAGMNGVVEKPMKPEHLLQALRDNLAGDAAAAA
jgi:two-component system, sensor histidine kinase